MDLILIILILTVTTHGAVQINLSDGLRLEMSLPDAASLVTHFALSDAGIAARLPVYAVWLWFRPTRRLGNL
jgi:hypothetical protein